MSVAARSVATREIPAPLAEKLTAAASSFGEAFEEARMHDIAEASGIPRATLYYYFPGKDEVLAFLLRSMLDDLRISVAAAIEAADGGIDAGLAAVVRAQLAHLAANPGTGRLLLANLGKAGRLPAIAAGVDEGFHAPVRRLLSGGIADGSLRELDVEVASSSLYGAVTIVGLRALRLEGRIDVDRLGAAIFDMFWLGIAPLGPASTQGARR
jgi:TetR/AcrR family transcriptional regulator